ncbi:response regulator transcription factor [Actinoplanes sp. TRM 88003]|uniref:Response regulator transcription factor n=1 Tax=Paractinoplanes aksuensis TaxID=2939490 RepID=A0ABT1DV99_9ACTN|nr:response regulator transcription factor [Actinoplanes aksuensis]MCO8273981.1 response regulator transcription factor [Actinoplanes aksuensis]
MRTVLAEDELLLRAGLTELLTRFGFTVCAAVGDAGALAAAVGEHRPDLVVTDVRMPPGFRDEGLRTALALRAAHPGLAVAVLSQYVEPDLAARLLDSGAGRGVGYLLKERVAAIAHRLHISDTVVGKHIGNVLAKLDLPPTDDVHRRVMAVLTYLRADSPAGQGV